YLLNPDENISHGLTQDSEGRSAAFSFQTHIFVADLHRGSSVPANKDYHQSQQIVHKYYLLFVGRPANNGDGRADRTCGTRLGFVPPAEVTRSLHWHGLRTLQSCLLDNRPQKVTWSN